MPIQQSVYKYEKKPINDWIQTVDKHHEFWCLPAVFFF